METVGTKLAALKIAAGATLKQIAKVGDWKGISSVQMYFHPHYDHGLRSHVAERLARTLGDGVYEVADAQARRIQTRPAKETQAISKSTNDAMMDRITSAIIATVAKGEEHGLVWDGPFDWQGIDLGDWSVEIRRTRTPT